MIVFWLMLLLFWLNYRMFYNKEKRFLAKLGATYSGQKPNLTKNRKCVFSYEIKGTNENCDPLFFHDY